MSLEQQLRSACAAGDISIVTELLLNENIDLNGSDEVSVMQFMLYRTMFSVDRRDSIRKHCNEYIYFLLIYN